VILLFALKRRERKDMDLKIWWREVNGHVIGCPSGDLGICPQSVALVRVANIYGEAASCL
jgi:hypothetical protein